MSVTDWSPQPSGNAMADPSIPAHDSMAAREYPKSIRGLMAGVRAILDDRGGAITTQGQDNTYVAISASGVARLRPGIRVLVRIDRTNTDEPALNLDGTGAHPWCNRDGVPLAAGLLEKDQYVDAIWDDVSRRWLSDAFNGLTSNLFDVLMRTWWLSLPTDPRGIGPNAPWRNGGLLAWTAPSNPGFTIDSPEGRRLTLRLIREALPLSPDGLEPGEPWLNGDTIAFVPNI